MAGTLRMHFVAYNLKNLQSDMVKDGIRSQKDMQIALNAAAKVMERGLKADTPNSAKSGRSWQPQTRNNRRKWGTLRASTGTYVPRLSRLKANEVAGANWGYLPSRGKKAFVARFQNKGAFNKATRRFEKYHTGFIQRSELKHIENARQRYEEVLGERMFRRITNFNQKWSNRLRGY